MNGNRAINWIKNNEKVETPKNSIYLQARVKNTEMKLCFTWKTIKYLDTVDLLDIALAKIINLRN